MKVGRGETACRVWYLIEDGFQDGVLNMQRDEAIFRAFLNRKLDRPVLRLYGFEEPMVSYGVRFKPPNGFGEYPSCRRITGGGWVHHGRDLTFSVVAPVGEDPAFRCVSSCYQKLHGIVREALLRLGYQVELYGGVSPGARFKPGTRRNASINNCFKSPVRADLLWQGRKVVGGAQRRSRSVFLHQGSIDLSVFASDLGGYLELFERLSEELVRGFEVSLDVEFVIKYFCDVEVQEGTGVGCQI